MNLKNNSLINILLIDDDEDDFFITNELIEEFNDGSISIEWINNAQQGIQMLNKKAYQICLLDYRLGSISGLEVLKKILKQHPFLPIVMLTGKGDQEIDKQAMLYGATDYLVKDDIKPQLLERTIRYALERANNLKTITERENKYKNIFLNSGDGLVITNLNCTIVDLNPKAEIMLGGKADKLLQKNLLDFFQDKNTISGFVHQFQKNNALNETEQIIKNLKKEKLHLSVTLATQKDLSGEENFLFVLHDITKRKIAENLIRQSDKLTLTGRLARTIAHEIRNPLTNIRLSTEQLKAELQQYLLDDKFENMEMFFSIIERNSNRIQTQITELLKSSKPAELKFSKQNLNEILEDSLALAKDRLTLNKIKLIKSLDSDLPMIDADAEKLKTAFLNILINAIEAMEVEIGVLIVKTYIQGGETIVEIADNGQGMSNEDIQHLFDPFFSKKPKGVGLGLTASHNIITNHHGTIEVESTSGEGTVFYICFSSSGN